MNDDKFSINNEFRSKYKIKEFVYCVYCYLNLNVNFYSLLRLFTIYLFSFYFENGM